MDALLDAHRVQALSPADHEALDRDGYLLLRSAISGAWLDDLRKAFEAGVTQNWPVPRGTDWRHALVDLDPKVIAACRLPALIAGARRLMREPFFLSQVEGREPLMGGGAQSLHRDSMDAGHPSVGALIYLDDYGPGNGATRIQSGSHRGAGAEEAKAVILQGRAGDILLFDADVLHGATRNLSGAPRRTLLLSYVAWAVRDDHLATASLRAVRMDTSERFEA